MMNDYIVNSDGFIEWEEETSVQEDDVSDESPVLEDETLPLESSDAPVSDVPVESFDAVPLEETEDALVFTDDGPVHISYAAEASPRSVGDALSADSMVIYDVTVSGYGQCKFVVTPEQSELLEVTNGTIINWSSSNVSGALFQGEITERSALDTLTLTLLGRGGSNYATNYYRYGSEQYVTYYTVNGAYLQTEQTYVQLSESKQQSWSVSYWFSIIAVVCLLLLAVNALIRLLRRGVRG